MRLKQLGKAATPVIGLLLTGCSGSRNDVGAWDAPDVQPINVTSSLRTVTNELNGEVMRQEQPGGYGKPDVNVVSGGGNYKDSNWETRSLTQHTPRVPGFRGADADYIDKADVYWKLNWIRKQLQGGAIPSNLKQAVAKTRKVLMTTVRDRNFNTADEAVSSLEEGLEHLEAFQTLKTANMDVTLMPFGAGKDAVARYFGKDKTYSSRPVKSARSSDGTLSLDLRDSVQTLSLRRQRSTQSLSPEVQSAQTLALSYAEKYSASPEEMMRRCWRKAIEKTNKLRDDLGLMRRSENSDRDDVSIPVIMGTSHQPDALPMPEQELTENVVPVPDIMGSSRRTDVPASTFKEPADPFKESR